MDDDWEDTTGDFKRRRTIEERVDRIERILAIVAKGIIDHRLEDGDARETLEAFYEEITHG